MPRRRRPSRKVRLFVTTVGRDAAGPGTWPAARARHAHGGEHRSYRREFMDLAAGEHQRQRQAVAFYERVALARFTRPRAADLVAPFLAST